MLAGDRDDMRQLSLSTRKTNLARLLARRPDGIFVAPYEAGEIGPDLFRAACRMAPRPRLSRRSLWPLGEGEEPQQPGNEAGGCRVLKMGA